MNFSMDFSPIQKQRLEHYLALLKKWQRTINLVSKNTLDNAWERHILDSAQLSPLIKENFNVLDMGSGAGFPALVLAIIRPDLSFVCIESDERKCAFLRQVSRETESGAIIINSRIENADIGAFQPDMVTARALAGLKNLLDYRMAFKRAGHKLECLFPKGEQWEKEVTEAEKFYQFDLETYSSLSDPHAKILHISDYRYAASPDKTG